MPSTSRVDERGAVARSLVPFFEPARLKTAREARGLSQSDLARAASVTPAAISQFESRDFRPSATTLMTLADALKFPVEFFAPGTPDPLGASAFFRSLRSTPAKDRRRAEAWAHIGSVLVRSLEAYVRFPVARIPVAPAELAATRSQVEVIANAVRNEWKMGDGPIDNVVQEIERRGAVAMRLPNVSEKVDAFAVAVAARPIVILGAEASKDRGRFNAAHELGHLVMHAPENAGEKHIEVQAHWFAAEFLMPGLAIRPELPRSLDWPQFLSLKNRWGVSISALLMRCRDLGLLSPADYIHGMRYMSVRGWRRTEPGDLGPAEVPVSLARAVELATQGGVTTRDLASRAGLSESDVLALIGAVADVRPALDV